jgi:drug/metabolite transporter (DMT)-like permease
VTGLVLLALVASVLLGVSDFLGGTIARRVPLIAVLLISQIAGTIAILPRMIVEPFSFAASGALLWGVIGGVAVAVAVAALFRALAIGTMGVVAPITSLSVVVPVGVGLATGDSLTLIIGIGLAVAVIGTVLASGPEIRRRVPGAGGGRAIILAIVAALGFGIANLSVALGSASSVTTTLITNAVIALIIYGAAAAVLRQPIVATGKALVGAIAIGLLGVAANLCFALASLDGALSVVAVLASLYPVVTVLLSWRIHKERLQGVQVAGIVAVFAGVAAVASSM